MKNNVMFLLGMVMSMMAYGQKQTQIPKELEEMREIEEMSITPPYFLGVATIWQGHEIKSINDYVGKFVEYPQGRSNDPKIGTEVVQFEVSPTGELSNFLVLNSVSPKIDAEVIRVIKTTEGMWKPGFVNGQQKSMTREVSIVFKPHDSYNMTVAAKAYLDKGNEILHLKKNPKKALKYFNKAIRLLPKEESILAARGLCRYELGNEKGAIEDYNRIIAFKNPNDLHPATEFSNEVIDQMRRYAELSDLFQ